MTSLLLLWGWLNFNLLYNTISYIPAPKYQWKYNCPCNSTYVNYLSTSGHNSNRNIEPLQHRRRLFGPLSLYPSPTELYMLLPYTCAYMPWQTLLTLIYQQWVPKKWKTLHPHQSVFAINLYVSSYCWSNLSILFLYSFNSFSTIHLWNLCLNGCMSIDSGRELKWKIWTNVALFRTTGLAKLV